VPVGKSNKERSEEGDVGGEKSLSYKKESDNGDESRKDCKKAVVCGCVAKRFNEICGRIAVEGAKVVFSGIEYGRAVFDNGYDGIDCVPLVHPVGLGVEVPKAKESSGEEKDRKHKKDAFR